MKMKFCMMALCFTTLMTVSSAFAKNGGRSNGGPEFPITMTGSCKFVKYDVWSNRFCKNTRQVYLRDCTLSEAATNQFGRVIRTDKTMAQLVLGTGYLARCYPEDRAKILDSYFSSIPQGTIVNFTTAAQFASGKSGSARIDLVMTVATQGQGPLKTTENSGRTVFDPLYELFFMDPAAVGDWLPK